MPARVGLTYREYAALPDDGKRYELHCGELSVTPAPGTRHQSVLVSLTLQIGEHVKSRGLGKIFVAPTDCILSDTTVLQPDILYLAPDRLSIVSERGIEGAPTLVIEILSPSTARIDRDRKHRLYAEHRVPHYWIVDLESRTVEGYTLDAGVYEPAGRVTSEPAALPPFPDLELDPADLWS